MTCQQSLIFIKMEMETNCVISDSSKLDTKSSVQTHMPTNIASTVTENEESTILTDIASQSGITSELDGLPFINTYI